MKYRVRNKDGELEYESFKQLEEAVRTGFVDAQDELLREGETEWKSASFVVKAQPRRPRFRPIDLWIAFAVGLGVLSLWSFAETHYVVGGASMFALVNVIGRITWKSSKRKS